MKTCVYSILIIPTLHEDAAKAPVISLISIPSIVNEMKLDECRALIF